MTLIRSSTYFILLGRPLFLFGGFLFHGLGVGAALWNGASLDVGVQIWGQIAVTSIQVMTQYGNEYFDLAADQANQTATSWSGGSRILPNKLLKPAVALWAASAAGSVALAASLWLAANPNTGPGTLPLLLLSLILAWNYQSPPIALNERGLGEIGGAIIITGLTPLVGF